VWCFRKGDTTVPTKLNEPRYPAHGIFNAPWDVPKHLMGSHNHHPIWKAFHKQTKEYAGPFSPPICQLDSIDSLEINCREGSGNGIESRGLDDHVKIKGFISDAYSSLSYGLNRIRFDIDQPHVRLVASLKVTGLEQYSLRSESLAK
jgi:hypothetical protein